MEQPAEPPGVDTDLAFDLWKKLNAVSMGEAQQSDFPNECFAKRYGLVKNAGRFSVILTEFGVFIMMELEAEIKNQVESERASAHAG
jgi:hypothetical protein